MCLLFQVVDMALALEAVSLLETTPVTKEALEVNDKSFNNRRILNTSFSISDYETRKVSEHDEEEDPK